MGSTHPHELTTAPKKHVEYEVSAAETPAEDFWYKTVTLMVFANKG